MFANVFRMMKLHFVMFCEKGKVMSKILEMEIIHSLIQPLFNQEASKFDLFYLGFDATI
jgi:hypothetical protein